MARKKKHPEHVNHERWLVSYADFITLLFAFFVVMFAASNSDQRKAGQIAKAVQVAFSQMAVFTPAGKVVPLYDSGGLPSDSNSVVGNTHSGFDATQLVSPAKPGEGGKPKISDLKTQLETILKNEISNRSIHLSEDSRGLTISLTEAGFFEPGSAVMNAKALAAVQSIAATVQPLANSIRVEGHTDNTPIQTPQFPSNWELSTARATFLLHSLISYGKISPQRLSAVGYGEYHPIAPNNTAEGRAANRRVDVVILSAAAEKQEPELR
jgi:chemotaxis protein MotB